MEPEQEPQAPAATEGKQPSDDSESSAETAQEYSNLKVDELKKKLKQLALPVSGRKSELIERLIASSQEAKDEAPEDEESRNTEFEDIEGLSRSELRKLRKKYHLMAEEIRVKRDELNLKSQTHASNRKDLDYALLLFIRSNHNCTAHQIFIKFNF